MTDAEADERTEPQVCGQPREDSVAEQAVLARLRAQLPAEVAIICGQRVTSETSDAEIDMLIIWPERGIVVLEVKGGQVSMRDGAWYTSGRHGSTRLKRGPLEQAMEAKHTLARWLKPRTSFGAGRMVQMACLPFSSLRDWTALPDAPGELLIDEAGLERIADRIEHALSCFGADHPPITAAAVPLMCRQLRQTHHASEASRMRAAELDSRSNQLTAEQERILSVPRYQTRAELSGGPGSGKTHLALLKARQLTRDGMRGGHVLFTRSRPPHAAHRRPMGAL